MNTTHLSPACLRRQIQGAGAGAGNPALLGYNTFLNVGTEVKRFFFYEGSVPGATSFGWDNDNDFSTILYYTFENKDTVKTFYLHIPLSYIRNLQVIATQSRCLPQLHDVGIPCTTSGSPL